MLIPNRRFTDFAVPALRWCALCSVAVGASLGITFSMLMFYVTLGRLFPTGKAVFSSFYWVVGWFILAEYVICVLPLATRPQWKRRKWRRTIMWTASLLCTVALATEWVWADLLDSIFALLFLLTMHFYRKGFLHKQRIDGWLLLFLAGSFVYLTNADKVVEYPDRGFPDYSYVAAYVYWAAIHCYMLHLLLRKHHKPWGWVVAALLVIYFPVLELPGELARQYVGRQLTGHRDNLYYTKLRPNMLHAVRGPDYECVICFERTTALIFRRKRTPTACIWPKIDQSLRTPSFALWLNERCLRER